MANETIFPEGEIHVLCGCFILFFFVRFITVIRKLLPGSVPRATNHHIAVTVLLELDVLRTSMSQYLMFSSFQVNGLSELKKVEESQDGSGGEKLYNVYTSFCYHKSIFICWEVSRKGFRSWKWVEDLGAQFSLER